MIESSFITVACSVTEMFSGKSLSSKHDLRDLGRKIGLRYYVRCISLITRIELLVLSRHDPLY
jgi:hypothetical protein